MTAPAGWYDLVFRTPYELDDAAEAALEDYARVVARVARAEALRTETAQVSGVRLVGGATIPPPALRDIEDFARDLAVRSGGSGLGWA